VVLSTLSRLLPQPWICWGVYHLQCAQDNSPKLPPSCCCWSDSDAAVMDSTAQSAKRCRSAATSASSTLCGAVAVTAAGPSASAGTAAGAAAAAAPSAAGAASLGAAAAAARASASCWRNDLTCRQTRQYDAEISKSKASSCNKGHT